MTAGPRLKVGEKGSEAVVFEKLSMWSRFFNTERHDSWSEAKSGGEGVRGCRVREAKHVVSLLLTCFVEDRPGGHLPCSAGGLSSGESSSLDSSRGGSATAGRGFVLGTVRHWAFRESMLARSWALYSFLCPQVEVCGGQDMAMPWGGRGFL